MKPPCLIPALPTKALLGVPRSALVGQPLHTFVAKKDQDIFSCCADTYWDGRLIPRGASGGASRCAGNGTPRRSDRTNQGRCKV